MRQLKSEETIAIAVQLTATFMDPPKVGQSKDGYIVQFAKSYVDMVTKVEALCNAEYLKLIPKHLGGTWDGQTED